MYQIVSKIRKLRSEVAQSCPTLCDPVDCSLPGSSVHGIFQAIVLEWIAIILNAGETIARVLEVEKGLLVEKGRWIEILGVKF